MKFIRKALLPGLVAAGFLGFLGAVGPSVPTASAYPGDICAILGPTAVQVGSTNLYRVVIEDIDEGGVYEVDISDQTGNGDITSRAEPTNDYEKINPTNSIGDLDVATLKANNAGFDVWDADFIDTLESHWNFSTAADACGNTNAQNFTDTVNANKAPIRTWLLNAIDRGEECSGVPPLNVAACQPPFGPGENGGPNDFGGFLLAYQDNDVDCGLVNVLGDQCSIPNAVISAVVDSLADSVARDLDCSGPAGIAHKAELAALNAGATEFVAGQIEDYILNYDNCGTLPGDVAPNGNDGYAFFDVTCKEAGTYQISVFDQFESDNAKSIEVVCSGDVDTGTISANPGSVEINPSIANVGHSLVWVDLKDNLGKAAAPGTKVIFTTDRCAIESSAVDTEDEFEAAEALFRNNNALNPATAQAVEASVYATTAPDGGTRQQEEVTTFDVVSSAATDFTHRTIAAVILHCDPIHAPSVTPGPAVVTAIVDRGSINNGLNADNDDLVLKTTVTVVGPPAANGVTVTAAPATLTCGEKATITADVKDAIGQPVSDHTLVEAVTNAGGVLAGTGAVAGQAGLVTPVSSTVAETFGGKATFYLLTSTANVGKYEVVITTGGGGGVTGQLGNGGVSTNLLGGLFTTAPISVQVTVECTVPQAAAPTTPPSTSGPTTGQGIRPPSTGDAGLVSTESNSWVLAAAVAVVVSLAVAGVSVKLVREE